MKTFGGITIDDLLYCPSQEYGSGIKTQLLYAPESYFRKFNIPELVDDYTESITIKEDDIEFRGKLGWCCIDILIEENELKSFIDGTQQRKKIKSELNFFILGFTDKNVGFIEVHKNTPFVFGVVDANGTPWIIGNLRNRAFFSSAEVISGKKYEDNSGISIKITTNSCIYRYSKKLEQIAISGAFSKGFSLGFNS